MEINRKRYDRLKSMAKGCNNLFGTSNPFEICRMAGIGVRFILLSKGIYGFSDILEKPESIPENVSPINAMIYLSSALNSYAGKIVCAHELGHVLLQKDERLNLFDIEDQEESLYEYEANLFAIELMPQIYHSPSIDYRDLTRRELYQYMNQKITTTFFTL